MTFSVDGFILTRRIIEHQGKTCVECWLVTDEGPLRVVSAPQKTVFFITSEEFGHAEACLTENRIGFEARHVELKTFDHQPVIALYFETLNSAYQARDKLKGKGIECFEDDVRLTERYLMERFAYGSVTAAGELRQDNSHRVIEGAKVKGTDFGPKLHVASLDIECSEQGELYCIGMTCGDMRKVWMIGSGKSVDFIEWVEDERALLQAWVDGVSQVDPDVFIGWNVVNFDFRVLIQRAQRLGVPLLLGRRGEAITWRDSRTDANQGFVDMSGRLVIDGIDALKTATYQFESFSLESVAQALLSEGKEAENADDSLAEINHNFVHNKEQLARYNLKDCELVERIFQHTRLMDFLVLRSCLTGLELDRVGGSVAAFINLYLPKLHRSGYVSPNRPGNGGLASPGGYVMSSMPGLYKHVLVLDFKSLYPSIIRTFKIDPMGLVEGLADPSHAIPGFKEAYFHRDKHFLPDIITSLWKQRDEAKRQSDAARSQAIKILMNSFYGVLGSGGCPFYDTRLASSITLRGHEIMQTTAAWIKEAGYEVIYGDTDSTFVWLDGDYSVGKAYEIGETLQQTINERWHALIREKYQLECHLEIEFETHFERFLMPTIRGSEQGSKKRYAGLRTHDRRAEHSSLVFKGLESVRTDWTGLARQFQRTLYEKVFSDEPVADFVRRTIEQTRSGEWDQQLVYRKRLRQRLEKYVKNVPPHVRAARLADEYLASQGKRPRYQNKGWVSYVMTVKGPEPLEHHTSPLDYDHYVEKQLRPIAEAILPFTGQSFDELAGDQLALF